MKLEDIAKKAGVSRSTVSRVINGGNHVSKSTRQKVLRIIETEHFTPNPAARALVTRRTNVIGIVLPYPLQDVFSADDPHYFATIIQGISRISQQRGYATLLWLGQSGEEATLLYQRVLQNRMMDGLIITASVFEKDNILMKTLLTSNTPFVLIGRPLHHANRINYVTIDNTQAAQQLVQHLFNQGRRRIGTITGNPENADAQDRLTGYRLAHRILGMPVDEKLIKTGRFSREWGYMCMKQLLKEGVDAVFAGNDIIASGAIRAIKEAGHRVPEDIAVAGFDDIPAARQSAPGLTTVRQPIMQKAARAATLLLDLISGKSRGPAQIILPTQLIIRESCGG